MIDRLADRHRCVSIDLRGFGRSPAAADYSVASHADDVLAVAATLGAPFMLVGHSMGGKLALAAAARRPPGLAGLALLAPSPPGPEPIAAKTRAERLAAHGDLAAARTTLRTITASSVSDVDARRFVADALACSPSAWAWWLRTGSREDISADAKALACPLHVLLGCVDPVIPIGTLPEWLGGPRPPALTLLADTGHLLPLERPAACADALDDFARSLA